MSINRDVTACAECGARQGFSHDLECISGNYKGGLSNNYKEPVDALTEAVKRMEAVPVDELAEAFESEAQYGTMKKAIEAVRARLIQAAQET